MPVGIGRELLFGGILSFSRSGQQLIGHEFIGYIPIGF